MHRYVLFGMKTQVACLEEVNPGLNVGKGELAVPISDCGDDSSVAVEGDLCSRPVEWLVRRSRKHRALHAAGCGGGVLSCEPTGVSRQMPSNESTVVLKV